MRELRVLFWLFWRSMSAIQNRFLGPKQHGERVGAPGFTVFRLKLNGREPDRQDWCKVEREAEGRGLCTCILGLKDQQAKKSPPPALLIVPRSCCRHLDWKPSSSFLVPKNSSTWSPTAKTISCHNALCSDIRWVGFLCEWEEGECWGLYQNFQRQLL